MNDPGRPPKPRSLNLLESLVKEEEELERQNSACEIYVPLTGTPSNTGAEYHDSEKISVDSETSASSNSEIKMKETKANTKAAKANGGSKNKKMRKPRSRSNSSERFVRSGKKSQRPFSADYNQNKREHIQSKITNGRVKSAKGPRQPQKASSKGQRPRSPASYSSDTYSSDEDYPKKEVYRKSSKHSADKKKPDHDDFFDSDKDQGRKKDDSSSDSSSSRSSSANSYSSEEADHKHSNNRRNSGDKENKRHNKYSSDDSKHSSSSDSSDSEADDRKDTRTKQGRVSRSDHRRSSKTVYVDKLGRQHSRKDSVGSDDQRMVVVDDYSSISEDEDSKSTDKPVRKTAVQNPSKRLLSRKKKKRMTIVQIDPDLYIEGKLQQKYCELEELMACSFVDQKSQMTRHHLYQMELLRDQYKSVSHGLPSSGLIIPRSLPEEIRNRGHPGYRPGSAKHHTQKYRDADQESCDYAYGTIRSVMTAERARKHNKIRTDINADRPSSAKKSGKKKKKLEATLKSNISASEEDVSEKPSTTSKGSASTRSDGSSLTPRSVTGIDHHIKYSENEKLKRWLKEKNKLYRQHVKAERKKKKEERDKLIDEANDKLERKIESRKRVKEWEKEKHKELIIKHKEEMKMREKEKKEQMKNEAKQPEESVQIKQHRRVSDVTVESDKCKGQDTPEYVKQQIHDKREIDEENKQAKVSEKGGPHPPQTKFIYKRPVAGKIKLNMQNRGKSPTGKRYESADKGQTEKEKEEKMRLSYDEWIKKKIEDDLEKRRNNAKLKDSEMAKSDPELNRLIPDIAKRRIEDKLNMRKKINTGIKSFDEKANSSFGGGEFEGDAEKERPRSAYRLEGDTDSTVKQNQRPSTAPARGRVPQPKKSTTSPRKAIIPQRADKVMSNKDDKNPFILPFPPEKGIPAHVAARQRKLFADKVADKLGETDQMELLQEVLIKEGVADINETDAGTSDHGNHQDETDPETIENVMYSPKRREQSSDSSDSEKESTETAEDKGKAQPAESPAHIDSFGTVESDSKSEESSQNEGDSKPDVQGSNQYRTYENLNDLPIDSPTRDANHSGNVGMDLGIDIDQLREKVESLRAESTGPPLVFMDDPRDSYESRSTDEEEPHSETVETKTITIISEETDPNLVGILKETKKMDNIPVPEHSDDLPEKSHTIPEDGNDATQLNQDEYLHASRKRVSFNEQPEVFQSIDSSSTDTVTPDHADDFDPDAESLDAQPYYVDEPEGGYGNNYSNIDGDSENRFGDDENTDLKLEGETLSFNIAGIKLNPTVIEPQNSEEEPKGEVSTFITNPESDI